MEDIIKRLSGVGGELATTKHAIVAARRDSLVAETPYRQLGQLKGSLAKPAINRMGSAQGSFDAAKEATSSGLDKLTEVVGTGSNNEASKRGLEAAQHAAGLLSGEIRFEDASLPSVMADVDAKLHQMKTILQEMSARSEGVESQIEGMRSALDEHLSPTKNGWLDQSITAFNDYRSSFSQEQ